MTGVIEDARNANFPGPPDLNLGFMLFLYYFLVFQMSGQASHWTAIFGPVWTVYTLVIVDVVVFVLSLVVLTQNQQFLI